MPAPYSKDLRWRAIWLAEIVGLNIEEVSFYLQISSTTIKRYVQQFRRLGDVGVNTIGRPYYSIVMHPYEELVLQEFVLEKPEKTLSEMVEEIYGETGSLYTCSTIHYYLRRNDITRKKVSGGLRLRT